MTKKENFYFELLKVQNEVSMKKNGQNKVENLDEYVTTTAFRKKADQLTMKKLEEEMAIWKKQLDELNEKEAIKAWLETDEGKKYIKERKDERKNLYEKIHAILDSAREHTSKTVKALLGEQWDVTSFSDGHMEIAIVKEYTEDGRPLALFGHDFDVYFRRSWTKEDAYDWEMNFGAMGSFDLNENNSTRIQHMVGMAKFAGDTTMVPDLRDYLHSISRELREIDKKYDELDKEIKNPKMA